MDQSYFFKKQLQTQEILAIQPSYGLFEQKNFRRATFQACIRFIEPFTKQHTEGIRIGVQLFYTPEINIEIYMFGGKKMEFLQLGQTYGFVDLLLCVDISIENSSNVVKFIPFVLDYKSSIISLGNSSIPQISIQITPKDQGQNFWNLDLNELFGSQAYNLVNKGVKFSDIKLHLQKFKNEFGQFVGLVQKFEVYQFKEEGQEFDLKVSLRLIKADLTNKFGIQYLDFINVQVYTFQKQYEKLLPYLVKGSKLLLPKLSIQFKKGEIFFEIKSIEPLKEIISDLDQKQKQAALEMSLTNLRDVIDKFRVCRRIFKLKVIATKIVFFRAKMLCPLCREQILIVVQGQTICVICEDKFIKDGRKYDQYPEIEYFAVVKAFQLNKQCFLKLSSNDVVEKFFDLTSFHNKNIKSICLDSDSLEYVFKRNVNNPIDQYLGRKLITKFIICKSYCDIVQTQNVKQIIHFVYESGENGIGSQDQKRKINQKFLKIMQLILQLYNQIKTQMDIEQPLLNNSFEIKLEDDSLDDMKMNINGTFEIINEDFREPHWFQNRRLKRVTSLEVLDVLPVNVQCDWKFQQTLVQHIKPT